MDPGFVDTVFPAAAREFYTNLRTGWGPAGNRAMMDES